MLLAVRLDISKSHDWEGDLGDGGGIISSSIVVIGIVLGLNVLGDGLDLVEITDDVLVSSLVDLHLTLCLPVVEPVLENANIGLDLGWAGAHEGVELWEITKDLLDTLKNLAVVFGSEVSDDFADVSLEALVVLEASLHCGLVVVSGESVHESSDVVCNNNGGELEVSAFHVTKFTSWDWESDLSDG